ncbi:MAG TPA: endonuclease/exonuclease/phosphatase family protein [Anaerolineales bacterium]
MLRKRPYGEISLSGWQSIKALVVFICLLMISGTPTASSRIQSDLVLPCEIQGKAQSSPYLGQHLRTRGVVFADLDETSQRGFFMQAEDCDDDTATSDGLFVYTGSRSNLVTHGDLVEVEGQVQEYYGMTEINTAPEMVTVLSSHNSLPEPVELNPPLDDTLAQLYFEALEGMYVKMETALVVGPMNSRHETWVVNSKTGVQRVFQDDPRGTGELICIDNSGLYELNPEANFGDWINHLRGLIAFRYGSDRIGLLESPTLIAGNQVGKAVNFTCGLSIATFNLRNFFDPVNDPDKSDLVVSGAEYLRRLSKIATAIHVALGEPSVLALQEVENRQVLEDLVARNELTSLYGFILEEGPDERGIDVALLYRQDRARVLSYEQRQGCTALTDGLGPDGNGDVIHPTNIVSCDADEDGNLDGNRLFSRPPLLVHMEIYPDHCLNAMEVYLIINHWKSKGDDIGEVQYTLPRRVEQADFVGRLYREIVDPYPHTNVVVLGDMNDYPVSQPLFKLQQVGLRNLIAEIRPEDRYTYIYQGISQVFDHILVSSSLENMFHVVVPLHFNADYAESYSHSDDVFLRTSDHDPLVAWFADLEAASFFPLIRR